MIKICPLQDVCKHFKSGDTKPPNHHVRATIPCTHWIILDCEKMMPLVEVYQWASGEIFACELAKRAKIYKKIKGKK